MAKYQALVLACLVGYCLGSGGAEVHQAASNDDDFRVLNVSKPLQLYCNTTKEGGGSYTMDWFKDGNQLSSEDGGRLSVFTNGTVKITSAKESDVGNYTCRARSESYTRTFTVLTIFVKKLPKSGTAIEKDKLTLTCEAEGNPMPTVTWMKGNVSITEAISSSRLEFKTSEKYPPNCTIIISDIVREDRGLYVCSISNHKNVVRTTSSFIRIKDIYAALWPFLGIVAEVVVLCLVIFIYEKRRTKNDFEESDTDQGGNMKDGRN